MTEAENWPEGQINWFERNKPGYFIQGCMAFREGKPPSACPYKGPEAVQWQKGWDDAKAEA